MKKREFERVTPEAVGVSSAAVERLLDELTRRSEMHGIMLMRHGKVFAEGCWAPYALGLRHALHSHSKTYYATGFGVGVTNGLVSIDERLVDIFPDDLPKNVSDNLASLKVRHVLGMSAGFDKNPSLKGNYLRNILATPVEHEPGTFFRYNSHLSNLLAIIFEKKTGIPLGEYMRENLYEKIGIDPDNVRCLKDIDGVDCSGGGLLTTIEDNVRLMKLYLDGGVCGGERVLSEEYVRLATGALVDNVGTRGIMTPGHDYTSGYGFQIWRCSHKCVFRDAAHPGIYTIACPEEDMVIAVTETEYEKVIDNFPTLEAIWRFVDSIEGDTPLKSCREAAKLAERLNTLALPSPKYAAYSPREAEMYGSWRVTAGRFSFDDTTTYIMLGRMEPAPAIDEFGFSFTPDGLVMDLAEGEKISSVTFAVDGGYHFGLREEPGKTFTKTACCAAWIDENTLELTFRWMEGCYGTRTILTLNDSGLDIVQHDICRTHESEPIHIKAVRKEG